ncbi:MAG: DUF1489 domain-containing protein [Aestuariivita sp.]|nr:DUF1489 domain-containing protein [Aestuariivita sp.]
MTAPSLNLIKLCVGAGSIQDLIDWQITPQAKGHDGKPRHVTRMWPRRFDELLNGGSLFWVIKGHILCRQKLIRFDEVIGLDGIKRCGIVLDPQLIKTHAVPKRPFQGWRYLKSIDAPFDLSNQLEEENAFPAELERSLNNIGIR